MGRRCISACVKTQDSWGGTIPNPNFIVKGGVLTQSASLKQVQILTAIFSGFSDILLRRYIHIYIYIERFWVYHTDLTFSPGGGYFWGRIRQWDPLYLSRQWEFSVACSHRKSFCLAYMMNHGFIFPSYNSLTVLCLFKVIFCYLSLRLT